MRGPGLVLTLVMTGCFFKPGAPGAISGDDVAGDGGIDGVDGRYPDAFGPFGIARSLGQLHPPEGTEYFDTAPFVYEGERELFFSSSRGGSGFQRLYVATVGISGELENPVPVYLGGGVTDSQKDGTITRDGKDLYFFDSANVRRHLHRDTIGGVWAPAPDAPAIQAIGPFDFGAGDLRIVSGSTSDPGSTSSEIMESTRTAVGQIWTTPVSLGLHAGSSGGETAPTLSADGREMFYEDSTAVNFETWRAVRTALDQPFTGAVFTVAGFVRIGDPELSPDGQNLYFTALNPLLQLYVVHRDPL